MCTSELAPLQRTIIRSVARGCSVCAVMSFSNELGWPAVRWGRRRVILPCSVCTQRGELVLAVWQGGLRAGPGRPSRIDRFITDWRRV